MASGDESSSQYDSESDYSDNEQPKLYKPVFIPKNQRITILEQEEKALQEELLLQSKKQLNEERVTQTRMLVADSIRRADEAKELKPEDADSDAGLPDDTDNIDEELEFEDWKVREIMRLKRDAEEREAVMIEKADLIRRRNMTDAERMAEDRAAGKFADEDDDKPKRAFMQKYYHKGVFYMDSASMRGEDDVRHKDYAAEPTLEDKIDKEKLPEVLRVKNFGKRGRTKYTHLVDQDTTVDMKAMKRTDIRADTRLMDKYLNKRSGVGKL
jgi:microfibrillar-associated protein 1